MPLKALIFDVDGTLYRQGALQRAMCFRLLRAYAVAPRQGIRVVRALQAYRQALELLRREPRMANPAEAQIDTASSLSRLDQSFILGCVHQWMEREPLAMIGKYVSPGLFPLLMLAKANGLRLAVFSDYAATDKLAAMGLTSFFEAVVSARDSEVQRLKPNPLGLEVVLERLGLNRDQAIYAGDRPEVDGETARRAGMKYLLVSAAKRDSFGELARQCQA